MNVTTQSPSADQLQQGLPRPDARVMERPISPDVHDLTSALQRIFQERVSNYYSPTNSFARKNNIPVDVYKPFMQAIQAADLETIKQYVESGQISLKHTSPMGNTWLQIVVGMIKSSVRFPYDTSYSKSQEAVLIPFQEYLQKIVQIADYFMEKDVDVTHKNKQGINLVNFIILSRDYYLDYITALIYIHDKDNRIADEDLVDKEMPIIEELFYTHLLTSVKSAYAKQGKLPEYEKELDAITQQVRIAKKKKEQNENSRVKYFSYSTDYTWNQCE